MIHNAIMTRLADLFQHNPSQRKVCVSGFTLVELLVASSIAALLSTLTWTILIENTKLESSLHCTVTISNQAILAKNIKL